MATITLPSTVRPNAVRAELFPSPSVLTPPNGGEQQLMNWLGTRVRARFFIPPKLYRDQGRVLISRLMQAKSQRLLVNWPQPGFAPGSVGTPLVRVAVTGGTTLQIKGLPPGKTLVEGQWLSVVADRRYLHNISADATANGSGDITLSVWPPMRTAFAVNDVVEIAQPKIEGLVLPGEELGWDIAVDKFVAIEFTVSEGK